jgi:TatD DNase family protein
MASSTSSSTPTKSTTSATKLKLYKFVDIGANLLDERYTDGIYYGKKRHESDFDSVLDRAIEYGVTHIILTAGTVQESKKALSVVREYRKKEEWASKSLFIGCTVGIHPTRCQQEFIDNLIIDDDDDNDDNDDNGNGNNKKQQEGRTADDVLDELYEIAKDGITDGCVVAIGEIGLDYDRLEFTSKDIQNQFFKHQLKIFLHNDDDGNNDVSSLPLFLHNRSVGRDLIQILQQHYPNNNRKIKGVVHSFDDQLELALEFIDLGLYIGLNGCSLKTQQNLDTIKQIPLSSILLETDCPYCEIKPTHAGYQYIQTTFVGMKKVDKKFELGRQVKGRNEPCQIIQIAEVIAGVKDIPLEDVVNTCYENSMKLYKFQ